MKQVDTEAAKSKKCLKCGFHTPLMMSKKHRMKFTLRSIFFYGFMMISLMAWGQKSQLKKANAFYDKGEFYEALQLFNKAVELGAELDVPTKIKLGHCYYNLNNMDVAYEVFDELKDQLTGIDLFTYASTTHKIGFYSGAIDLYKKARPQMAGRQSQIDEMIKACEWAEQNDTFNPLVLVNPSTILTFGQSFGIQYYDKGVVYSSAAQDDEDAKKSKKKTRTDKQGMSFLNLYYSDVADGQLSGKGRLFSEKLVFDFHVGAISFTANLKQMYFTKTVRIRGGESRLKIYKVTYDGREWVNEEEISINSNEFDNAHPAVSADDKSLYFVSNRPGGYGGKDIYVVERRTNGSYGTPRNLGPQVNTFGDEQYPYISKDNTLYFASDGHIGFGGLDLFKAEYQNSEWTNVQNMMKPFNGEKDDFGYVIDPNNPYYGFLSSNRAGNGSNDVIFYVRYNEEEIKKAEDGANAVETALTAPSATSAVFGTKLMSTLSNTPIEGATVVIKDTFSGSIVAQGTSTADGLISIVIPDEYKKEGQEFEITVSKGSEFQQKTFVTNIDEFEDFARSGISLTPVFNEQSLNEISDSKIPYVGNQITADGYKELDRLAAYLLSNPNVVVKLNGHTEAKSNKSANLTTSQTMAEQAEQYLLSKGIPDDNIIPRGYGERYPVNGCRRGKVCSEKEHLENRRIDVVVWRFLNQ
jgi:outer membrane protein OmpA-like peptidoglycan-associated protein/tetratricopeptide (TPR) repeat protein